MSGVLLRLHADDGRPLYEQIAGAVRAAIGAGELRSGDRLPAGRDLAGVLDVNLDTVQRAYRALAAEGLVVSRVGRGTTVAADVDVAALSLGPLVDALVVRARELGLADRVVLSMVRQTLARH